jgi:hypothetical protein
MFSVHAHNGKNNPDIYDELLDKIPTQKIPLGIVWLYFPLAVGETIVGGWMREHTNMLHLREPALVVSLHVPIP